MTQPTANEQLSAYLDGELNDVERDELERALAEDPALRQELARLEKAVSFLKMHGPVQAPRGFQEKVLAQVANEPMPGWWWRWMRRPFGIPVEGFAVALAAAMVLLVALPFGLKTVSQTGKDLASDPYGFVRSSEEGRAGAAADKKGDLAAPPPPATAAPIGEEPEVADLDEEGQMADGSGSAGLLGTDAVVRARPTPAPAPEPAPEEEKSVTTGTVGAPDESANAPGTAGTYGAVQAAAAPNILLKYDVLTYDEDALVRLQRIAAKYRGAVTDASGASAKSLELEPGQTYLVEIPASALAAFGDDLHELGMVTETPDPRKWAGDTVRVQVTFQVIPSPDGTRAYKAMPSAETEAH